MRICFIGNSHLATAKFGWDAVAAEYPAVEASFFGAIASVFANVAIEEGKLVPKSEAAKQSFRKTSGGRDVAVFADYDVVVLFALSFGLWPLLDYYDRFRWGDQNNSEGDYELVSTGYLHEIVKGAARAIDGHPVPGRNPQWRCARAEGLDLSRTDAVPIRPDVGTNAEIGPIGVAASALRRAAQWHDERSLGDAYSAARDALSGDDDVVFKQPAHTIAAQIFTLPEYSDGSIGLSDLPSLWATSCI